MRTAASVLFRSLALSLLASVAFAGGTLPIYPDIDYRMRVALGRVPGHSLMAKFGENPDIDLASGFETIWDGDGIYVPPTQARIHTVASTDADDDGTELYSSTATGGSPTTIVDTGQTFVADATVAVGDVVLNDSNVQLCFVTAIAEDTLTCAGSMRDPNLGLVGLANEAGDTYRVITDTSTGASILHILGLDASRLTLEEFVMLDGGGANAVLTANAYVRQFRGRVFASGSAAAEGLITSTADPGTDNTVTLQVINGNNQTLMTPFTCAADEVCYIVRWWGSMSKNVASSTSDIHLRGGTLDGVGYLLQTRAINTAGNPSFDYVYAVPIPIPGGADIWIEANASANDTAVAAGFDVIRVANP